MKQLELFKDLKGKEIQLRERSATTLIPNSTHGEVTSCAKPDGGNPWAVGDKPKALSPEITSVGEIDKLHFLEGRMANSTKGEEVAAPSGSEARGRREKDSAGTQETGWGGCHLTYTLSSRKRYIAEEPGDVVIP